MRHFRKDRTMGIIEKSRRKNMAGFSLLELMVVVAILGALATIAVPRYNIFRARARQGEAKLNLDVIFKLQEAFKIEHEQYYDGDKVKWGGESMNDKDTRQGFAGGTTFRCQTNKLGFRLAECSSARYGYYIAGAQENEFLAIAFGESSQQTGGNNKRIYPGCNGTSTTPVIVGTGSDAPTSVQNECQVAQTAWGANLATGFTDGDAWCTDEKRNLENYRDIVEHCTD